MRSNSSSISFRHSADEFTVPDSTSFRRPPMCAQRQQRFRQFEDPGSGPDVVTIAVGVGIACLRCRSRTSMRENRQPDLEQHHIGNASSVCEITSGGVSSMPITNAPTIT